MTVRAEHQNISQSLIAVVTLACCCIVASAATVAMTQDTPRSKNPLFNRPSKNRKYKKVDGEEQKSAHFSKSENAAEQTNHLTTASSSAQESLLDESDSPQKSEHSSKRSMEKVALATKKTLSKPLSVTKKIVKSTGSAVKDVSPRNKSSQRDSGVSQVTVEEQDEESSSEEQDNMDEIVDIQQDKDDSTVMVSNSVAYLAKQTYADDEKSRTAGMIYMGPVLAILLHDATIAIGISLMIAAYPTLSNLDLILDNQIPWTVSATWILVAFAIGYEVALFRFPQTIEEEEQDIAFEDVTIPSEIDVPDIAQQRKKRGYSVLSRMSVHFPNLNIHVPQKVKESRAWSSLTTKRGQQFRWQRRARAPVSDPLMKRLLRNPMYQRVEVEEEPIESVPSFEEKKDSKMGTYQLPDAESLKHDVIEPQFVLRGMDVFMTENLENGAEDNMSEHPFLIENGLRDTPSFVVNMMTQWANILIYFELPDWLKDWDSIVEQDDDPDDVKALKQFLNGDDEYKSQRLKMLPYLVDGPYPIKVLAPPKREITVHCDLLPTKWHQSNGRTLRDGRYLHPCLELELDLMANKTMRGFASLVKRYLVKMSVDVAVIVQKPDLQEEEEGSACLGMWRFDKVDVSQCPNLPERLELGRSVKADTLRATMLMKQTELDLASVREELEGISEVEAVAA